MVAGDLVNTASRIQSRRRTRHGARRRGDAARDRGGDRLRGGGLVRAEGEGGAGAALAGAARHRRARRARSSRRASRRRSSAGTGSSASSRISSTRAPRSGRRTWSRSTGIAGIGKSRLAWEFYKYIDGLAQTSTGTAAAVSPTARASRTGRSPRWCGCACRHRRGRGAASAAAKLQAALEEHMLDAEERRFVEPRLAQLLGLDERRARRARGLFAAWRLFFERLAETYPIVLVFEDMQWADTALLDFIEYLLEWSRSHPLFVLTLARPELLERRPTWGAGSATSPRSTWSRSRRPRWRSSSTDSSPGSRRSCAPRSSTRAEGVPLYAVETVRMLLDRGAARAGGPRTGRRADRDARGARDAARADRRPPRRAPAGGAPRCSRTPPCSGRRSRKRRARGARRASAARARAAARVARPQGGPHASRRIRALPSTASTGSSRTSPAGRLRDAAQRERRARHLAAAAQPSGSPARTRSSRSSPRTTSRPTELVPDAADAAEIQAKAHADARARRRRAASLAALAKHSATSSRRPGSPRAHRACRAALGPAGMAGSPPGLRGAGCSAKPWLTMKPWATPTRKPASRAARDRRALQGRFEDALARAERAFEVISGDEPDEDLASLVVRLATAHWFAGDPERAAGLVERALDLRRGAAAARDPLPVPGPRRRRRSRRGARRRPGPSTSSRWTPRSPTSCAVVRRRSRVRSWAMPVFRHDRYGESLGSYEQSLALARKREAEVGVVRPERSDLRPHDARPLGRGRALASAGRDPGASRSGRGPRC